MADSRDRSASSGSALLVSAMAGAVLGAAGLAWWLLHEADRRRQSLRQQRMLRLSRLQGGSQECLGQEAGSSDGRGAAAGGGDALLQDRVHQLNQAIEDVRRQLEQLQTQP